MRIIRAIIISCILISALFARKGYKEKEGIYAQLATVCQDLYSQVSAARGAAQQGRLIAAVVDFTDNGEKLKEIEFGKGFADMATKELSKIENVSVANRNRTESIMKELELSLSGLVDEGSTKQIGRLLAADVLIGGSCTQVGANIVINFNATDVETAEVLGTSSLTLSAAGVLPMASAASLESKYPATAAFRSFSVPGWGMFYNDKPAAGIIYCSTTFSLLATAITFTISSKILDKEYKTINIDNYDYYYPKAKSIHHAIRVISDKRRTHELIRLIAWSTTGTVWLINIFHSLATARKINRTIEEYTLLEPSPPRLSFAFSSCGREKSELIFNYRF